MYIQPLIFIPLPEQIKSTESEIYGVSVKCQSKSPEHIQRQATPNIITNRFRKFQNTRAHPTTETRLATLFVIRRSAPCPTGNPMTCSPSPETSATTVDPAYRISIHTVAPDCPCENNQRNRQKVDNSKSFDANSPTRTYQALNPALNYELSAWLGR